MNESATTRPEHPPHRRALTVVQVLPALDAGGVERGTVEVADELVRRGHRSIVISAGGRLVQHLLDHGSEHITWDIGQKSPWTLRHIRPLRRLLRDQRVDVLHARSRLPAWISYLAWRRSREKTAFVTTMHGLHSVSRYSGIMTRGQRVIAVSDTVRNHIVSCYPKADASRIRVIHRGVDPAAFPHGYQPPQDWLDRWYAEFPELRDQQVITLPGRITRLKGHKDLIELIGRLRKRGINARGLIVGGEDPQRQGYAHEVRQLARQLGEGAITFTGHRSDVREIFAVSDVVLSLSNRPESFGRTVLEALSLGVPVAGYDHGGVGEVLGHLLPQGRVPLGDLDALTDRAAEFLRHPPPVPRPHDFTLQRMLDQTLAVYDEVTLGD